jgi:fucose permease
MTVSTTPTVGPSRRAWLSTLAIYLGFAATGIGMALPGSVMPALLARWSLTDSQAGFFLFAGWLGSSIGALLVARSRARSLAIGAFLAALGTIGMAFASHGTCYAWMAIFGLGLGLTMTSTSLLQAGRHPEHRGVELNRLNLVWALGACICPTLATHSLRVMSAQTMFLVLGAFFACFTLWIATTERNQEPDANETKAPSLQNVGFASLRLWPLGLVIAILLPTGIESSMGGWIAAYVQRTHETISTTVTAGTCFWVGLMLSRLISSVVLRRGWSERAVLIQSLITVFAGTTLMIAGTSTLLIVPGIFLVGFGLGPVYPLLLAYALQYSQNTAIFFVAGLGSALLPWLTGIVSSSASSLRLGLVVPLAASMLMLGLGCTFAFRPVPATART